MPCWTTTLFLREYSLLGLAREAKSLGVFDFTDLEVVTSGLCWILDKQNIIKHAVIIIDQMHCRITYTWQHPCDSWSDGYAFEHSTHCERTHLSSWLHNRYGCLLVFSFDQLCKERKSLIFCVLMCDQHFERDQHFKELSLGGGLSFPLAMNLRLVWDFLTQTTDCCCFWSLLEGKYALNCWSRIGFQGVKGFYLCVLQHWAK